MIEGKELTRRAVRSGAELGVVFALVLIAIGLVVLVSINFGTSADIRKESHQSHVLAEMQIALTTAEEAIAAWQVNPIGRPHPSADPDIAEAAAAFDSWKELLLRHIETDEVPMVDGLSAAFHGFVEAAISAPSDVEPRDIQALIAFDLAARGPLLDLLEEENDQLLESVEADRRAEQWLRWGSPVLLILALLVLAFVLRLRDRGRQLIEQRKVNEAQTEFIGSVSHELRTPLTSVVAYSRELRDRFDDLSPAEIGEMVQALVQESDEVAAIVDDLLVAARIETDRLVIKPEPLDIREEIDHALDTVGDFKNVEVDALGTVLADRGRLRQILRNLISNAQRYGGERIRISGGATGDEMLIVVADSGPPVPLELHSAIFEPFTSAVGGGGSSTSVGLGLTVSRNLATLMGGRLWYSHEDGWSRLNLGLPLPTSPNGAAKHNDPLRLTTGA